MTPRPGRRRQPAFMSPDMAVQERRFGRAAGPTGGRRQLAFMGPDMAAEERRFGRGGGPAGGRRQLAFMGPDMAAEERRFGRGGGPAGGRRQLAFMGPDMAVEERRFGRGGGPTGGGRLRADSRGMERIAYDEFAYFRENAAEFGLPYEGPPVVRRESVGVGPGGRLSALVWGDAPPEIVLLHGGAQNAHTWDTVALALGRPLVAIDLPGHGHSDAGALAAASSAGGPAVEDIAADVAQAIRALAPDAAGVVGMSLGGLTTLALAHRAPELVRR